jgi:serine/threonine protein phosphatase 1
MRTFVIGDLHGAWKAMAQCFERSGFDRESDKLIFLGDVADGWSEVPECIEELLRIRNLVALKGNHDIWFQAYLSRGEQPEHWLGQGGVTTVRSYEYKKHLTDRHLKFLESALPYYLDDRRKLFVHAGFNPDLPVEKTDNPEEDYYWSREVYRRSFLAPVMPELYAEIYIGHTPTRGISEQPVLNHNVWLMDQGAAWQGFLSMMDIDSKEFFQSDRVTSLYPGEPGRMGLMNMMS